jgi:hypothetical protein
MSAKQYRIVYEDELTYHNPTPDPFFRSNEAVVRHFLKMHGFDLNRTISKVLDWRGWCWVQRK